MTAARPHPDRRRRSPRCSWRPPGSSCSRRSARRPAELSKDVAAERQALTTGAGRCRRRPRRQARLRPRLHDRRAARRRRARGRQRPVAAAAGRAGGRQRSHIDFRELKGGGSGSRRGPPAPAPPPAPATPGPPRRRRRPRRCRQARPSAPAGFPTMPFSFTFTGDFFRMSDFIGRLERFLVVRNQPHARARALHDHRRHRAHGRAAGLPADPGERRRPRLTCCRRAQGLTDGATAAGPLPATARRRLDSERPAGAATATPVGMR